MVKRQKEKQYQSAIEHRQNSQIRSGSASSNSSVQRKLPFHCCALTLTPFHNPVCTSQGIIFDNSALMEFLFKHKKDPVTGKTLTTRDVITLQMDKDEEGRWQCPVLTKPFANHTKIVAVVDQSTKEGYVYSHEAYKELNQKTKNWFDLTTGRKFNPKKDVLILNDPQNEDFQKQRDIQRFWHIVNSRLVEQNRSQSSNVRHSVTASRIMEKLQKDKKRAINEEKPNSTSNKKLKIFADDVTGVQFTSGKASGSFTSTAMEVTNENTTREASQEEILLSQFQVMKKQKQKGYVRMITNLGDLLLELHCDIAPRTCTNFLGLCQAQKYDNTTFHRSIKNFMIQGGSDKSSKDASLWGPAFVDEFDDRLKHDAAGILSSANAGPNTNKRQFFITFKETPHLDRKHSVFGQVVDGMKVLKEMENVPTDKKDRPVKAITILKTEILLDPAKDAKELEEKRIEEMAQARREEEERKKARALGRSAASVKQEKKESISNGGIMIGKYLPKSSLSQQQQQQQQSSDDGADLSSILPPLVTKPKSVAPSKTKFGNFSSW